MAAAFWLPPPRRTKYSKDAAVISSSCFSNLLRASGTFPRDPAVEFPSHLTGWSWVIGVPGPGSGAAVTDCGSADCSPRARSPGQILNASCGSHTPGETEADPRRWRWARLPERNPRRPGQTSAERAGPLALSASSLFLEAAAFAFTLPPASSSLPTPTYLGEETPAEVCSGLSPDASLSLLHRCFVCRQPPHRTDFIRCWSAYVQGPGGKFYHPGTLQT